MLWFLYDTEWPEHLAGTYFQDNPQILYHNESHCFVVIACSEEFHKTSLRTARIPLTHIMNVLLRHARNVWDNRGGALFTGQLLSPSKQQGDDVTGKECNSWIHDGKSTLCKMFMRICIQTSWNHACIHAQSHHCFAYLVTVATHDQQMQLLCCIRHSWCVRMCYKYATPQKAFWSSYKWAIRF